MILDVKGIKVSDIGIEGKKDLQRGTGARTKRLEMKDMSLVNKTVLYGKGGHQRTSVQKKTHGEWRSTLCSEM
jgi:hypothetical protein